jgi:ribosomal protein S7
MITTSKLNITLYNKVVGFLTKKGKRNKAVNILNSSFLKINQLSKKPTFYVINKLFSVLNVYVETRTVRVRGGVHTIPFILNLNRRIFLIVKWLISVVKKNSQKSPFFERFTKEISLILNKNSSSKVFRLKVLNENSAIKNRSNIHYRW